jgi:hypothetical protein
MGNLMNSNAIHNALNILILFSGSAAGFDFSTIGLSPSLAGKATAVLAITKLLMNAVRDGVPGMVKPQPPVQ